MKEHPFSEMDQPAFRIAYLIAGYIRQVLTEAEQDELDNWVNASDHNMALFEELTDEVHLEANLAWMESLQTDKSFQAQQEKGVFRMPSRKGRLIRQVTAIAAMLVVIVGVYFLYRYLNKSGQPAQIDVNPPMATLMPGSNRAMLTLGDGRRLDLTTAHEGSIDAGQGSHASKPADGALVYESDALDEGSLVYHTLSTPVGGQYQVQLTDGTKVWLNAASSLRYPNHFSGKHRVVELTGEGYFEVSKHDGQSFEVRLPDSAKVEVMGTHFNVMAYPDIDRTDITLLEGRVKVSQQATSKILDPGTKATLIGANITTQSGVDTDAVIGWKNGLFVFHDAPIETIMQQVAKWYDAKIIYQGTITQLFNASIYRSEPLSKLLHLLELTGSVHFKIEHNTIYVFP